MTSDDRRRAIERARPVVRHTLEQIFRKDEELTAFCQSYFPAVSREFTAGMVHTQKLNILLEEPDHVEEILKKLETERQFKTLFSEQTATVVSVLGAFLGFHAASLAVRTAVEVAPGAHARDAATGSSVGDILTRAVPAESQAAAAPAGRPPSPFRPLTWFEREDRDLFFGRDLDTIDLAVRVRTQRLCALHGASGTGKSSLLRAGLWPLLARDFAWFAHSPGSDFDASLRAALVSAWKDRLARDAEANTAPATQRTPSLPPDPPADPVRALAQLSEGRRLLWVIDQAEELFVGCPPEKMITRALDLARLLQRARNDGEAQIFILLVVRNDYLGHLALLKPVLSDIFDNSQLLLPLDTTAARAALVEPFRCRGLSLTPDLISAMEKDLRDAERQTSPIELQLICQDLYENAGTRITLDLDLYRSRGGTGNVLGSYLRSTLAQLGEQEQEAGRDGAVIQEGALAILRALLGAEGLRAPALPLVELVSRLHLPLAELLTRLEWLVTHRLVRSDQQPAPACDQPLVATYRLSHDLLAKELHAGLSAQQKQDQDTLDDLRHRAAAWDADGRHGLSLRREQCESFLLWASRHDHIEPRVAAYLTDGVRRQLRRQLALRIVAWSGVPVLLIAAAVSVYSFRAKNQAAQAQIAEVRAEQFLERDPAQAMAWIAEAARLRGGLLYEPDRNFDEHWLMAREAWDRGLGWVAMQHKQQVFKVAFTPPAPADKDCPDCWPRRKLLASASEDGQVLLLDLEKGGLPVPLCTEGLFAKQPCTAHQGGVEDLVFAPDGRWLATCGPAVQVFEVATRRLLYQYNEPGVVWSALAVSPDGTWLAVASGNGGPLLIWDTRAWGEPMPRHGHNATVKKLAFASHQAGLLASGAQDGTLLLTEVATGAQRSLHLPSSSVEDLAFALDGRWLAAAGHPSGVTNSKNIAIFSAPFTDSEPTQTLYTGGGTASRIAFSGGSLLVSGDDEGQIQTWDLTGSSAKPAHHFAAVWALQVSSDARWIASAGNDEIVKLTYRQGFWHKHLGGHMGRVAALAFAPDGRLLASGGVDGTVRLWPIVDGRTQVHVGRAPVRAVGVVGDRIAASLDNGKIVVWRSGEYDSSMPPSFVGGRGRAICTQGDHWVVASEDGTLRTFQAPLGNQDSVVSSGEPADSVACASDGTRYTGHTAAVRQWLPRQTESVEIGRHQGLVLGLALSPSGQQLVSVSKDHTAVLWDLAHRQALRTLNLKQPLISAVWLDTRTIALGGEDGQVRRWDPQAETVTPLDLPQTARVHSLDVSTERHWLALASSGGLRLLSVGTQAQRTVAGHNGAVASVRFAQDRLLSGGSDGVVLSYALPPTDRAAFAKWLDAHLPFRIEVAKVQDQPVPPLTEAFAGPIPPPVNPECQARCRQHVEDHELQEGMTLDDCIRICL